MKNIIQVRDQEGTDFAVEIMREGDGKLTMDEVRSAAKVLIGADGFHLYGMETTSEMHANRSRIIVLAGCLGLVFLLFNLGYSVDFVVQEREEFARRIESGNCSRPRLPASATR